MAGVAQTDITRAWRDDNPAKADSIISAVEKLRLHKDYLTTAVEKNDVTQQFYGNIYLYTDYMDEQDYPAAVSHILTAENIAKRTSNINWQGFVKLKTGWVARIVQNDVRKAIQEYKAGAKLSALSKDSLCMALCFEQISAMYSSVNEYDSSQLYFNLAIPVLRRSATVTLDAAYSNFSGLLLRRGKGEAALLYIDSAITIIQQKNNKCRENFFLINRAVILNELKRYDSAEKLFKYCMTADTENKWMENLMYDYEGLSENYHETNNDDAAFQYLIKYHSLKDSLSGVAVNLKVAGIMAANKSELDRLTAEKSMQKRNGIIVAVALVLSFIIWLWIAQIKKAKRKQAHTRNNLEQLTRILLEKNSLLTDIEQKISVLQKKSLEDDASLEQYLHDKNELLAQITETKQDSNGAVPSSEPDDFEKNIYNQRILTPSDWSAFKIYFEKAYPGYLLRLRNAFPLLTEAEERIFLFTKLNLTNKEAAAMLGISADSVKKTRSRLRHRLQLDETINLDEFVKAF